MRLNTIDCLRGLAIIMMVAANFAAQLLVEPHPLWFRFYGSFAAPLFIFLAGVMIPCTQLFKGYQLPYFLGRGSYIFFVAILIDLFIWRVLPMASVDVLYLIGWSLPVACLFLKLSQPKQIGAIAAVFLLAFYLQQALGYSDTVNEWDLQDGLPPLNDVMVVWRHWLVDGWFPIFPWLSFALLGAFCGQFIFAKQEVKMPTSLFAVSLVLLGLGAWWFSFSSGVPLTRDGYSEIFYPATPAYCLMAVGVIGVLFYWVERIKSRVVLNVIGLYGHYSLSIYVIHLAMGEYVLSAQFSDLGMGSFAVVYLASLLALWVYCLVRKNIKNGVSFKSMKLIFTNPGN